MNKINENGPQSALSHPTDATGYHLFFDANPQPMWVYDLETLAFLAVNDAAVARYGYSRDEFLGMTLGDIRPPEDVPALLDNIAHVTGGLDEAGVWRHYTKEGRLILVEITSHTLDFAGRRAEMVLAHDVTRRLEAERAMRQALGQVEQLLAVAGALFLVLDPAGHVVRINPFGCALLGRAEMDILGRDWFQVFVPLRLRDALRAQYRGLLAGDPESLAYHDNPVLTAEGDERLISWHNALLHDEQGRVTGVLSSGRDITDLRLAEENLHASEERLRIILETAADAILALDADGQVVFANPAAGLLLAREVSDLVGQPITDLMPERYRAAHLAGFTAYQRSGKSTMPWQHIPLTVLHHDGREIPVEVSFGEQRLEDGHLFIGVIRDVSERHRAEEAVRASERKYRTLVEHLPLRVFQKDQDSVYVSCNENFARFLGVSADDIAGHTDQDFFPPELASKYRLDDQRIMATGQREELEEEYPEQGETHTARTIKTPVRDENGRVTGVLGLFSDITEHKRTGAHLRQAAKVFESTAEGVTITDAQGNIVAVNRAFCEITGYAEAEVLGQNPRLLQSGRHDTDFYRAMWAGITATGNWRGEIWNRRKNGEVYPEWLTISTVRDEQQRLVNYVGVFSDISHIKRSEAQLEHLTLYDPLTELPNRLLFNTRLEHALERARHKNGRIAVLYLDMDRFKTVNDSLGHPIGDELLIAIARRLAGTLNEDDTLGRLGGDEFVVLLEDLKQGEDAAAVVLKMLHVLERPFQIGGRHEVYIAASAGVSLFPDDGNDATQLLRNADAALYQAKEQGRNTYRFYTEALTRAAGERLTLEAKLRRALERGEFVLHYQPQVSVRDGVTVGMEALVRWQHPEEGLIPPARFIPLAEETGLIVPLGEWVLFTACAQMKEWLDRGLFPVTLAVNLSPRQFRQADLVQHVHAVLDATDLPPHLLELEITESAIMEQGSQAVAVLHALKALGVQLAIDDFGTGYSSLAYLKRFAVDKLKIDQSFIRDIPQDRDDMEIAATIIAMARNLRLEVLAEGVETEAQLDVLREHGCETYQGYLFSRPLPAAEVELLLAQGRPQSDP